MRERTIPCLRFPKEPSRLSARSPSTTAPAPPPFFRLRRRPEARPAALRVPRLRSVCAKGKTVLSDGLSFGYRVRKRLICVFFREIRTTVFMRTHRLTNNRFPSKRKQIFGNDLDKFSVFIVDDYFYVRTILKKHLPTVSAR